MAHLPLAALLYEHHSYAESIEACREIFGLLGTDSEADNEIEAFTYLLMGMALYQTGEESQAREAWTRTLELAPSGTHVAQQARKLLEGEEA